MITGLGICDVHFPPDSTTCASLVLAITPGSRPIYGSSTDVLTHCVFDSFSRDGIDLVTISLFIITSPLMGHRGILNATKVPSSSASFSVKCSSFTLSEFTLGILSHLSVTNVAFILFSSLNMSSTYIIINRKPRIEPWRAVVVKVKVCLIL